MKLILPILLLAIQTCAFAEDTHLQAMTDILSTDGTKAYNAAVGFSAQRRVEGGKLIDAAKSLFSLEKRSENDKLRLTAILLTIGKLGHDDAVDMLLIPNLIYKPDIDWAGRTPRLRDEYPCAGALIDIGCESMPKLFRFLQTKRSKEEIMIAVHTIQSICAKLVGESAMPVRGASMAKTTFAYWISLAEGESKQSLEAAAATIQSE